MSVADKKTAKKVSLINAAFELFTNKGINPTAIDEVVKRAGVAKGTFYLYFKDKYDLLDQITVIKCEEVAQEVLLSEQTVFSDSSVSPSDKVILFLDRIIERLAENRSLAILILRDMAAFRKLWEPKETESELYRTLLSLFIEGGCDEENAPKQMYMTFIAAASVCCDCILYQSPYTTEEIKPQIHSLVRSIIR